MNINNSLIEQYLPIVAAVAERFRSRLTPAVDFEDLVAQGNLALLEAMQRADPERLGSLGIFLASRVRGAMLNLIQQEYRHANHDDLPEQVAAAPAPVAIDTCIEMRTAVRSLPDRERQVIEMRFGQGMTQRQAARHLNVSGARVHEMEHRGIQRLRPQFENRRAA